MYESFILNDKKKITIKKIKKYFVTVSKFLKKLYCNIKYFQ